MKEKFLKDGRRYFALTDDDLNCMCKDKKIYELENGEKAIAPDDCKHQEYILAIGDEKNYKICKKCIFQIETDEPITVN